MKNLKIMSVMVVLLVVATTSFAMENLARSASYDYPTAWPGLPKLWGDTVPRSILTNGDNSDAIYQAGDTRLLVYFDLGQDYDLTQLKVLSTESPWDNNALSTVSFYVSSDTSGGFSGDYEALSDEAKWEMIDVAVYKPDLSDWVADTGLISTTGRYVAIWTNHGLGTEVIGFNEVQIFGTESDIEVNNVALNASYCYPSGWPGRPEVWSDTTVPSVLTDGDHGTGKGLKLVTDSVYAAGNSMVMAFFDFGQDYEFEQLRVLATESPWNNNALSKVSFYISTDANGPFDDTYTSVFSGATWSMDEVVVDKTDSDLWVVDTGGITVSGRYLAIWAEGDGLQANTIGLSEVQAFVMPQNCGDLGTEYSVFDVTGPLGVRDCKVDMYDFAALAADWLSCTTPNDQSCLGWYNY